MNGRKQDLTTIWMVMLIGLAFVFITGVTLPKASTSYALNFSTTATNPNALNQVLSPTASNCTGITSTALVVKGSNPVYVSGQYNSNTVNTTLIGPISIFVSVGTSAPTTTFSSGPCATAVFSKTITIAMPFINKAWTSTWAWTFSAVAGNTYYAWITVNMNSAFTGHIKYNQVGTQTSINMLEFR